MSAWADLADALGGAPRLDGALCRGSTMFDEASPGTAAELVAERIAEAVAVCNRCPSLGACGRWLNGLAPPQRPAGVVAGRVSAPEASLPRRKARSDLREVLETALRTDPGAADREVARLVGCHDSSVATARKRLELAGAIPRVRQPVGRPRGGRR